MHVLLKSVTTDLKSMHMKETNAEEVGHELNKTKWHNGDHIVLEVMLNYDRYLFMWEKFHNTCNMMNAREVYYT